LVKGSILVPRPATGITALANLPFTFILMSLSSNAEFFITAYHTPVFFLDYRSKPGKTMAVTSMLKPLTRIASNE
jgi:hypothetical protein